MPKQTFTIMVDASDLDALIALIRAGTPQDEETRLPYDDLLRRLSVASNRTAGKLGFSYEFPVSF